jgi:hypothetical protein
MIMLVWCFFISTYARCPKFQEQKKFWVGQDYLFKLCQIQAIKKQCWFSDVLQAGGKSKKNTDASILWKLWNCTHNCSRMSRSSSPFPKNS